MKSADLKSMAPVLDAVFQKAQARLHRITLQQDRLKQQLQELQTARSRVSQDRDGSDAATVAGADVRWQRWIDQRRKELNLELAQLAAQRISARNQLKKAFGRQAALADLLSNQLTIERKAAARRADQLS